MLESDSSSIIPLWEHIVPVNVIQTSISLLTVKAGLFRCDPMMMALPSDLVICFEISPVFGFSMILSCCPPCLYHRLGTWSATPLAVLKVVPVSLHLG